MDSLKDIDLKEYLQQAKEVVYSGLYYFLICICVYGLFVGLGLLLRYLSTKFGGRIKASPKKAILITGSTSGIGLWLAKRYFRKGFSVFATYYNSRELGFAELQRLGVAKGSTDFGPKLFLVQLDVTNQVSIDYAATEVEHLLDLHQIELYCVIMNAGIANELSFEFCPTQNIVQLVETNFLGSILVCRRLVRQIIQTKGRFIIVSSAFFNLITPLTPIYSATKAALKSFSDSLNESLKTYGVSCSCVCPGHFINRSNLTLNNARSLRESLLRMSDEERELYKRNIEEYGKMINEQIKLRLAYAKHLNEDPEQLLAVYGLTKPEDLYELTSTCKESGKGRLAVSLMGGEDRPNKKMIESDEMDDLRAFDDALYLRCPPHRVYAGSWIYQHIIAPFMCEFTPQIGFDLLFNIFKQEFNGGKA